MSIRFKEYVVIVVEIYLKMIREFPSALTFGLDELAGEISKHINKALQTTKRLVYYYMFS